MGTCVENHLVDVASLHPKSAAFASHKPDAASLLGIQQLFENQAEISANTHAVAFEDRRFTYGELNERANQLAHWLRHRGIGPESIVAVRTERSPEMILAILGILKAGGAYLPIDPSYPADRQQFMLSDAGAELVLSQQHLSNLFTTAHTLNLDSDWPQAADEPTNNPDVINSADDLAYVIYTSGSTGKPKGVQVTHRSLIHSTTARFSYYTEPVKSFLLVSSHAFDSSIAGIFWTLCQGGTLVLPHEYSQQTAFELAELIAQHKISHTLCLPSLYSVLLEQRSLLGSLRAVIVAGESCPAALVKRHYELLPKATLFNEYGPTEATVWSTVHQCEPCDASRTVPIGRAIPGAQVYILDSQLRPVSNGDSGELHVGGAGVARGYLNCPELTAKKFLPDPFSDHSGARLYKTGDLARWLPDGTIEFLGRVDSQIKIRGHRIELEEIEALLNSHEAVQQAAVIACEPPKTLPMNGEAEQFILAQLEKMDAAAADRVLAEVTAGSPPTSDEHIRQSSDFEVALRITQPDFIRPPRESHRKWLLDRALDEFAADLRELNTQAKRFVPGAEPSLQTFAINRAQAELEEQEILEDWHLPLMQAMARAVTETHGDVLEIGFGRGIASSFIQDCGVRSHTIVECNDSVISRFFEPWRQARADSDIRLVQGLWQDVVEGLGEFDGIFFQTYPLNEREFADYVANSVVFAEHFFPVAARHLKPGGAFTYLTHEIDSLSRRHQRLILQHFGSFACSVQKLQLPADCKDLWWADSMVVVKAIK
jgi:amino acid adenylation domain-containing protein